MRHSLFRDVIGWLDSQKSHFYRELVWGFVCEEINVKDAYFHVRNGSFFLVYGKHGGMLLNVVLLLI